MASGAEVHQVPLVVFLVPPDNLNLYSLLSYGCLFHDVDSSTSSSRREFGFSQTLKVRKTKASFLCGKS